MASVWVELDAALIDAVERNGHQWKRVLKSLPAGITQSQVRNRWLRLTSTKPGINKCSKCGMQKRGHSYSKCYNIKKKTVSSDISTESPIVPIPEKHSQSTQENKLDIISSIQQQIDANVISCTYTMEQLNEQIIQIQLIYETIYYEKNYPHYLNNISQEELFSKFKLYCS